MRLFLDIGHSERSAKPTALLGRCLAAMPGQTSEPGQGAMLVCAQGMLDRPDPGPAARAAADVMEDVYATATPTTSVRETLTDALTAANHAVRANGERGRAAALAAIVLQGARWYLAHAGNVRAWHARDQRLKQLTRDHVVPRTLGHHEVTKACGYAESIDADYDEGTLVEGDVFLVTSPGVHDVLSGADLMSVLQSERSAQQMAEALTARATAAGGASGYAGVCVARVDKLLDKAETRSSQPLPLIALPSTGTNIDGFVVEKQLMKNPRFRLYRARDSHSGDTVLLRFPDPAYPQSAQRFLREEAASSRVQSPYLLKPVAAGRTPTALYAVTEYRKCENLAKRVQRKRGLDASEALRLGGQLLALLEALHAQGIVHGDLRPQNLLYDKRRRQIYALGLTVNRHSTSDTGGRPPPSGSRSYFAPELFRNPIVTERSDIFAAGVTLYRMFSGEYPYGKIRTPEDWAERDYAPLRREGEALPAALDRVIARACAPDPADRYANAAQLAIAFNAARVDTVETRRVHRNAAANPPALAWWVAAALVSALLGYLYIALR